MNILEEILAYKKLEVEQAKEKLSIDKLKKEIRGKEIKKRYFYQTIKKKIDKKEIALIAEVKKASPSKGIIKKDFNPIEIAQAYKNGGACCLSVLTDEKYFQGNLRYVKNIKDAINLPVLRKDFIIDPYQIHESIYNDADCILLIVGAFHTMPLLRDLYEISCENEIDVLTEVHDERELEIALELNCKMIGINNRDLKTFKTDLSTTKKLIEQYKRDLKSKIIVSESGIFTSHDIKSLIENNVYAFLVGESLIIKENIEFATKELTNIEGVIH